MSLDEARDVFSSGQRAAGRTGDARALAYLEATFVGPLVVAGHLREGLAVSRRAMSRLKELQDHELRARFTVGLSAMEAFVGNLDRAEQLLEAFVREVPDESLSVVSDEGVAIPPFRLVWLAQIYAWRGRLHEAAPLLERVRLFLRATQSPGDALLIPHLIFIGELHGELLDAAALAAQGMKLAQEFGSSTHRYFALGGLARSHALRGEWEPAVRTFEEAIAFQNETGIGRELEGLDRASLAQALLALGQAERARRTAAQAVATCIERGSLLQELQSGLVLARTEVALDNDAAVDPLLARCETLIAETGASSYRPHLVEIRAERSRRRGDAVAWRAALAEAQRLFVETGATAHAERLSREL
jgi:tetratricopeptide (TPR) repeat protein